MIASQYILLWRQSKIALMCNCHIDGEIFNPIAFFGIKKMGYQNMGVCHNMSLGFLTVLVSEKHLLNLTLTIPHIWNFPNSENMSLTNG